MVAKRIFHLASCCTFESGETYAASLTLKNIKIKRTLPEKRTSCKTMHCGQK